MPIAQGSPTPHGSLTSSADCPQIYSLTWTYHFVNYKNFCCYTSLFCIAQSYKDTILIVVAQCFEMIATAYETSYEKPKKLQMSVLKEIWQWKPSSDLVCLLLKCDLRLLKRHFTFCMGRDIAGMSLLRWGTGMTDPKRATWQLKTNDDFNNWSVLLSNNWSATLSRKDPDQKGGM